MTTTTDAIPTPTATIPPVALPQALTLRCLATMQEVVPLAAAEADRPRMTAGDLRPLVATKRG